MKQGKEKLKVFIAFIIGFLLSSGIVYAATLYSAAEVSYDNSNSGTDETTVQGSVDELYNLAEKALSISVSSSVPTYTGKEGELVIISNQEASKYYVANNEPVNPEENSVWIMEGKSGNYSVSSSNVSFPILTAKQYINSTWVGVVCYIYQNGQWNKITYDAVTPDVTYAVTSGTTGSNSWYVSNVVVQLTPTAGSSGVSFYKYCTGTSNCTPSTTVNGSTSTNITLSTESANNKICTSVTNGVGITSEKCNTYKIDKTAPTITVGGHTSSYSVTIAQSSSYTIPTGTATDNLTSNVSVTRSGSVTPSTVGTYKVTYTATDEAGNTATLVLTVNVITSTYTYNYTGGVQSFTVPATGTYQLEVYGGQGQNGDSAGGNGGYSSGQKYLTAGTVLYIVVGGGSGNTYNGGGGSWTEMIYVGSNTGWISYPQMAGGGATHIATTNRGVLSNYNSYRSEVLIVAGGGGGGASGFGGNINSVGVGGGTSGTAASRSSSYTYVTSVAGTQTSGYAFGQGDSSGGGGWYGGRYSGGGSGYIGGVSNGTSTSGQRSGNGSAKITFVG